MAYIEELESKCVSAHGTMADAVGLSGCAVGWHSPPPNLTTIQQNPVDRALLSAAGVRAGAEPQCLSRYSDDVPRKISLRNSK
jgi:hypothetical protein